MMYTLSYLVIFLKHAHNISNVSFNASRVTSTFFSQFQFIGGNSELGITWNQFKPFKKYIHTKIGS